MSAVIKTRGLSVELGGSRIVSGVDLDVGAGDAVALLGANGSGKSTLVKALLRVVPSTGSAELFGVGLGPAVPWQRIGYMPQRSSAAAGVPATAEEIVTAGLLAGRRLRPAGDVHDQVHAVLAEVGLLDRAHSPIRELSGGQQQRVLIARALVRNPDLLILDEPVAGVDLPSQDAFAAALAGRIERGTTVLVVLHELGPLAGLLSRAVVLRHGRIVADGPPPTPTADHAGSDHDHVHPHGTGTTPHEIGSEADQYPGLMGQGVRHD